MRDLILGLVGFFALIALIYGGYWVGKNVSYWVFYEDMVIETIKEQVKPQYLSR